MLLFIHSFFSLFTPILLFELSFHVHSYLNSHFTLILLFHSRLSIISIHICMPPHLFSHLPPYLGAMFTLLLIFSKATFMLLYYFTVSHSFAVTPLSTRWCLLGPHASNFVRYYNCSYTSGLLADSIIPSYVHTMYFISISTVDLLEHLANTPKRLYSLLLHYRYVLYWWQEQFCFRVGFIPAVLLLNLNIMQNNPFLRMYVYIFIWS